MQPNRRTHANRSQSRRIHLDPHYFTGFVQRRAHGLGTAAATVPTMIIEPGAELRFAEDRRLRVGEGGDGLLDAQGTTANQITFTTIDSGTPVCWRGISVAFTHSNNYAGVIYAGSAPVFTGPPTDRVYTFNGFDCIRDVAAGTCEQV